MRWREVGGKGQVTGEERRSHNVIFLASLNSHKLAHLQIVFYSFSDIFLRILFFSFFFFVCFLKPWNLIALQLNITVVCQKTKNAESERSGPRIKGQARICLADSCWSPACADSLSLCLYVRPPTPPPHPPPPQDSTTTTTLPLYTHTHTRKGLA